MGEFPHFNDTAGFFFNRGVKIRFLSWWRWGGWGGLGSVKWPGGFKRESVFRPYALNIPQFGEIMLRRTTTRNNRPLSRLINVDLSSGRWALSCAPVGIWVVMTCKSRC